MRRRVGSGRVAPGRSHRCTVTNALDRSTRSEAVNWHLYTHPVPFYSAYFQWCSGRRPEMEVGHMSDPPLEHAIMSPVRSHGLYDCRAHPQPSPTPPSPGPLCRSAGGRADGSRGGRTGHVAGGPLTRPHGGGLVVKQSLCGERNIIHRYNPIYTVYISIPGPSQTWVSWLEIPK